MTSFAQITVATLDQPTDIDSAQTSVGLKSRLARRLFSLFVLAALLPLATLAGTTVLQVRSSLIERVGESLRSNAKATAMDFHLRLTLAAEQLDLLQDVIIENGNVERTRLEEISGGRFQNLRVINDDVPTLRTGQGNIAATGAVTSDRHRLEILAIDGETLVTVSKRFHSNGISYRLAGELEPALLWENIRSNGDLACVFGPNGVQLVCNSEPNMRLVAEVTRLSNNRDSDFFLSENGYYTAYWSLFESGFAAAPRFVIVSATPQSEALASINEFQFVFLQIVGLTLLLVAFVSVRAIKSNLIPLERLLAGTRSLSRGAFDARVDLDTGDEFEELGDSFNTMADEIGRSFRLQAALSNLGQRLQSTSQSDVTVRLVFETISEIIGSNRLTALYLSRENEQIRSFSFWTVDGERILSSNRLVSREPDLPIDVQLLTGAEVLERLPLPPGFINADRRYCVIPGAKDDREVAALLYETNPSHAALDDTLRLFLGQVGILLAGSLESAFLTAKLKHQANYDHLTGLPNRMFVRERFEQQIEAHPGQPVVVAIFDVDRFKIINDSQGHAAGDELLCQIAARLQHHLDNAVIPSRFAGDEFIILGTLGNDMDDDAIATSIVDPVQRVFSGAFEIGNSRLNVKASLGVATYPKDGADFITLLKRADAAMYTAKRAAPGSARFYSDDIESDLLKRIDIENGLREAIEAGNQFELHYQPAIDMESGRAIGCEALIRWNRPGQGMVSPGDFIPVAEDTGQIVEIGNWVLGEACRAFVRWSDQRLGLKMIALNVSGEQLAQDNFVSVVNDAIKHSGIPPQMLELEITETSLIDNIASTIEKLEAVRSLGVKVAIDDFGTGYSSLQYLKRLPIDKLKIDQMFVRGLPEDGSDLAIVRTLVALSSELNLTVLAEGCETEDQRDCLVSHSISLAQGWLFSRALPEAEFVRFVSDQDNDQNAPGN